MATKELRSKIINITNDFPNDTSYVEKDLQNAEMVLEENRLLRINKTNTTPTQSSRLSKHIGICAKRKTTT